MCSHVFGLQISLLKHAVSNRIQKKESVELATPYITGHIWQDKNRIISNLLGAHATLNNFIKARFFLKSHCAARTELAVSRARPPQ